MTFLEDQPTDLPTPSGPMRTFVFRPNAEGKFPGIILWSEIFQMTGPIRRTATYLAGQGFTVAVPEIFHEFEPAGTALAYDTAGTDRGNFCKITKKLEHYDGDARAVIDFLSAHPHCSGKLGTMGMCIGGHLSFRCAMNPEILASVCFYATDIHKLESHPRGLGEGMADDSLDRARRGDIKGELLMIWGRQDPHVPFEGRTQVREALENSGSNYQWLELNAAHAFIRDEGHRYDPVLATQCHAFISELFKRRLANSAG